MLQNELKVMVSIKMSYFINEWNGVGTFWLRGIKPIILDSFYH